MYIAGIDPDRRTTEAEFNLLQVGFSASGKGYIYIRAQGAIIGRGAVAIQEDGDSPELDTGNDHPATPVGIATAAFVDNAYGWVQVFGTATAVANNAVAVNSALAATGTDGRLDDTGTPGILGMRVTTAAGAAGNDLPVHLTFPFINRA